MDEDKDEKTPEERAHLDAEVRANVKKLLGEQVREAFDARVSRFWGDMLRNEQLMRQCVEIQLSNNSLLRQHVLTQVAVATVMPPWMREVMSEEQRLEIGMKFGNMVGIGVDGTDCDGHDCYSYTMPNRDYLSHVCQILDIFWVLRGIKGRPLTWLVMEYMWDYSETLKKMKVMGQGKNWPVRITPLIYSITDLIECLEIMMPAERIQQLKKWGVFNYDYLVGLCMRSLQCAGLPKSGPKEWPRGLP